jgi:hypothetical protein
MQPVNYAQDVQQPVNSVLQGFQTGVGIKKMMDERKQKEEQEAQLHQMTTDLSNLSANPTTQGLAPSFCTSRQTR